MIVVISKDKDFSHTLAEQVVRELETACECLEHVDDIKNISPSLIITTDKAVKFKDIPVIKLEVPVRIREVLSDIESALKRPGGDNISIGKEYVFSLRQKTLTHIKSANSAKLTDKEAQLASAIFAGGSAGISKETLLREIWGSTADLNTHTLETHIYRLRSKFKDISGSEMILSTDNGYRFDL